MTDRPAPDTRDKLAAVVGPAIAAAATDEDLLKFERRATNGAQPTGAAPVTDQPNAASAPPALTRDYLAGIVALADALKAEFSRQPYTIQKQMIVERIALITGKLTHPAPVPAPVAMGTDAGPAVSQGVPQPKLVEPGA